MLAECTGFLGAIGPVRSFRFYGSIHSGLGVVWSISLQPSRNRTPKVWCIFQLLSFLLPSPPAASFGLSVHRSIQNVMQLARYSFLPSVSLKSWSVGASHLSSMTKGPAQSIHSSIQWWWWWSCSCWVVVRSQSLDPTPALVTVFLAMFLLWWMWCTAHKPNRQTTSQPATFHLHLQGCRDNPNGRTDRQIDRQIDRQMDNESASNHSTSPSRLRTQTDRIHSAD